MDSTELGHSQNDTKNHQKHAFKNVTDQDEDVTKNIFRAYKSFNET